MSNQEKEKARNPSPIPAGEHRPAKTQKVFPIRNQGSSIFSEEVIHRDNSSYLGILNSEANAVVFTRPMQLGKTTLFSLAKKLFSSNQTDPGFVLEYMPAEADKNKWFILDLNFGSVTGAETVDWKKLGKKLDELTRNEIVRQMVVLLGQNNALNQRFESMSGTPIHKQSTPDLVRNLASAVGLENGSLLILVDEYDQPVREALLRFVPLHSDGLYDEAKKDLKTVFDNYFSFFRAVKPILTGTDTRVKMWLTGITPISIREMTGLIIEDMTFDPRMYDAVGLREADVRTMLEEVDSVLAFTDAGEKARVYQAIQFHYNNLRFLDGSQLFHTALVVDTMRKLCDQGSRQSWLQDLNLPPPGIEREHIPSSVYDVLKSARNLRPVVNRLVEDGELLGYGLNLNLTLEDLLRQEVNVDDYLTLLLHVGLVSVERVATAPGYRFQVAGKAYQRDLLNPLLSCLKSSLVSLLQLQGKDDLYDQGEEILMDFVTSISRNSMAKLIKWASKDEKNNILELQFQGHMEGEAYRILDGTAQTTQENVLPPTGKRTDITLSGQFSVVILELKQLPGADGPGDKMAGYHKQLTGYVKTRRQMEKKAGGGRCVVGFVVVMYNSGQSYVVEKLRSERP